jgi:hypothetical protein
MKLAAAFLLVLGLLQMAGDLLRLPALKGIGAATAASPAPKVFSAVRGLETFSTRFTIEWTDRSGMPYAILLTPELYARVQGPYNRRNVYGAIVSYGPVLATDPKTRPMFCSVAAYALGGKAPLLKEIGIDPDSVGGAVRIRYKPVEGTDMGGLPRLLEIRHP